jgi:hypothetical protein
MFPVFANAIRHRLLLPLGTATVERSFSTVNRIFCNERCRLHCERVRQFMLISIEGLQAPYVQDVTYDEKKRVKILGKPLHFG